VKTLAFVLGLSIAAIGVVGMLAPSGLVWIAQHAVTSGAFYVIAAVRVAFGLILISVASASRLPKTLRIGGAVIVVAGIATALTGLVGMERARTTIDWWLRQGAGTIRVTSAVLLAIGGFVAYACAPVPRAA
jgi:NO-binding membrane sensor protein with MHYT domain